MATNKQISEYVKIWLDDPNALSSQQAADIYNAIAPKLSTLAPPGSGAGISSFFEAVGSGVRDAQRQLDRDSLDYMATRLPTAAPAMFRIPRVEAEIQFAMQLVQGKKFDVLVFGRDEKLSNSQQQRVKFEIISAPPPPGSILPVDGVSLLSGLMLDLSQRDAVYDRLRKLRDASPAGSRDREVLGYFTTPGFADQVLIVRHAERKPKPLILEDSTTDRFDPGLVLMHITKAGDVVGASPYVDYEIAVMTLYSAGHKPETWTPGSGPKSPIRKADMQSWWFATILMDVAEWQEKLLRVQHNATATSGRQ